MLKKFIKTGVVMSLLLTSMSAFAQNTGKPEYPRYGFWSNWSIGGSFDVAHELNDMKGMAHPGLFGMDFFLSQKLNHVFDYRFRVGMPTLFSAQPDAGDANFNAAEYKYQNHVTLSLDIMISLNDAFKGYDPDRRFSIYLYGGPGASFNLWNADDRNGTAFTEKGKVLINMGQGMSYRFGSSFKVFAEYGFDATDIVNIFKTDFYKWHDVTSICRLGLAYDFGVTAADQAVAAQKAMLTQENFGALNSQVNNLERQVTTARNNEKKLENRIAELEDQLAQALAEGNKGGNGAAADSLQAVIDQIKADQLNFYAMPFSVLYGIDQWQVSDEESIKVKAVARVLKDNPGVKILVVGFADYSGSDKYNMKLSEKRAKEVKRLLVKKYGIAEDRIQTEYKGKSVAFGDIQYSLNRRVSFYRVIE